MAQLSRFSVLRIEDDSDEEFQPVKAAQKNAQGKPAQQRPGNNRSQVPSAVPRSGGRILPDGLIVHSQEKKKTKNNKKKQQVESGTSSVETPKVAEKEDGGDEEDLQLKQAIQESKLFAEAQGTLQSTASSLSSTVSSSPALSSDPLEAVLKGSNGSNDIYVSLLKDQLTKARGEMMNAQEKSRKFEADAVKYRDRFRKVLSILNDAELMEKAQLLHERDQKDTVINDIGEQLKSLQVENEKLRGRLSRFERV